MSWTVLLFAGIGVVMAGFVAWSAWLDHQRLAQMRQWAAARRWRLIEEDTSLPRRLANHPPFDEGRHRYVADVLSGTVDGRTVHVFDYHWQTESRGNSWLSTDDSWISDSDRRNDSKVEHHRVGVLAVEIGARLPYLRLRPENVATRMWGSIAGDRDTESHAFNQAFRIDGQADMTTTAMLNPQVMSYLLLARRRMPQYTWQFNNGYLLLLAPRRPPLAHVDLTAHVACEVLARIPRFVFEDNPMPPILPSQGGRHGSDRYGRGGIPGLPRWLSVNLRM